MEFKEVIRERYSCRKFSPKAVEQEKLDAILEAGRLALTAKNLQEQHVYVVRGEENLAKMDKVTRCRYGAPVVLIFTYDKNNVFVYPGGDKNSGAEDVSIVATHVILAAKDEGLESCWLNLLDEKVAAEEFGLPDNEEIVLLMDIGYAGEGAAPSEKHFSRKPLSDTVTYIG